LSLKKHTWKGLAVVAAMLLSVGLMQAQTAFAAATVTTLGNTTIPLYTNSGAPAVAAGTGVIGTPAGGSFTTVNPIGITLGAAGDLAGNITLTAPAGWGFGGTLPAPSSTAPGVTFGVHVYAAYGSANTATITVTAANTGPGILTIAGLQLKPVDSGATSVTGNITMSAVGGLPAGTNVATITPAQTGILIYSGATTAPAVTTVTSDGTTSVGLTFNVRSAANAQVVNTVVNVTVSRGTLSVTSNTTSSTSCSTGSTGSSCTLTFRGNGTTGTAQVTATTAAPNEAVATYNLTVGSATTTPTAIKHFSTNNSGHVAASIDNTYTTPALAARVRFQVTGGSGTGVNSELIQATVDKGYIAQGDSSANPTAGNQPGSCSGNNTTASDTSHGPVSIDGTDHDGIVEFTVCAKSGTTGPIKVTAKNLSTTMTDASTTVLAAGVPNKIETTVSGGAVTVTVKDKDGNEVADGTTVSFGVPAFTGTVAPTCTTTTNGKATAAAAFSGAGGQVLITVFINDSGSGSASTCGALGNSAVAAVTVNVGAGGGGGGATGGGFTGTAPARGSIGLLVTNQVSTAAGLVSALAAAGCTVESLAVLEGGIWKIYINGAPAVVNAAFPASVQTTVAFFVRCAP
jgi:hypothetical protein